MRTRIGRIVIVAMMAWLLVGSMGAMAQQEAAADEAERAAVRKVLDEQVAAWNRSDLEGYMQGHWKSPELTFYGGARIAHGWQEALERYIKGYKSAGKEMGQLSFSDVKVELIAPEVAFVRGQFHLKMSDGKKPHGLFTLLMRKFPEGWRIVHDHSSGE